jgi:hypothetical protein
MVSHSEGIESVALTEAEYKERVKIQLSVDDGKRSFLLLVQK